MINNPDIQPNASMNRWIAAILLFDFKLRHVPGKEHGPDGLLRRPPAPEDPPINNDYEGWINHANAFTTAVLPPLNSEATPWYLTANTFSIELINEIPPLQEALFPANPLQPRELSTSSVESLNASTPVPSIPLIPRSDKAKERDLSLNRVISFLSNPSRTPGLSEDNFKKLVRAATGYFLQDGRLWKKDSRNKHKLVIRDEEKRLDLIRQAHDSLGHKGIFTTRIRLLDRFWWPDLDADVRWYIKTCHECQTRLTHHLHIPPTVPTPFNLFRKAHIDTMFMPKSNGYRYIVHARCSLSSYPEFRLLRAENARSLATFIFEDILCRWGAIEELVTDNGPAFIQAAEHLAAKYKINHIRISPYNSQANGIVEQRHLDIREALVKASEGEEKHWTTVAPAVFWAERVSIQKSTGHSPYYIAHGLEPLLPFDLAEATYLAPALTKPISTEDLIATHAIQLCKRPQDLAQVKEAVLKSRYTSIQEFNKKYENAIHDFNFDPGTLVLVRNS
jgi:hypothetical protein